MKLNNAIKRTLINEYAGSEKKETVICHDGFKYMVKKPDPTREIKKRELLPYQNNVFSEFVGCKVYENIGIPVQDVSLWEYDTKNRKGEITTKTICLCKDVREKDENLREFEKISLGSEAEDNDRFTFVEMEELINSVKDKTNMTDKQKEEYLAFYYDMFIVDALIGNTDRHPGNIAIIVDENDNFKRICPVYDCGSSFSPDIPEKNLSSCNVKQIALSVDSAICEDVNGDKRRIRYVNFFDTCENEKVLNALKRIVPKIDLSEIKRTLDIEPLLSDARKQFYEECLECRFEKILLKGLENSFVLEKAEVPDNIDLYKIYAENIRDIAALAPFEQLDVMSGENSYTFRKVSNKYAISLDENGVCNGLIPIRSNNDEIRKAINAFKSLGIDICSAQLEISEKEQIKEGI